MLVLVLDHTELVKALGTFIAIMNPFPRLPVFLAMTARFTEMQQCGAAFRTHVIL